eukprot:TRINITY_DN10390_c0_g1_i2.p1 TRINITY_DN10390_c0_g1~~TRINITY_DN10390_c0_g1_i2.p1  ORF type:complete len:550 (-),score=127.33 TRINITY_DN10390_c0_g1_i2:48-1697(-)
MQEEAKRDVQRAGEETEAPQAGGSILKYLCLIFLAVQLFGVVVQFYGLLYPSVETAFAPGQHVNLLKYRQHFDLAVYLLNEQKQIDGKLWEEKNLTYIYNNDYPITKELQVDLNDSIKRNKSNLYLMAEITSMNHYRYQRRPKHFQGHHAPIFNSMGNSDQLVFQTKVMPLIKYDKDFEVVTRNLLEESNVTEVANKSIVYPYFKSLMYVTLIFDTHGYYQGEFAKMQLDDYILDENEFYYSPLFYLNDFWTLRRHLVKVNETTDKLNLTLILSMGTVGKHLFMHSFNKDPFGMYTSDVVEEMKEIFSDTNIYLLIVTFTVYTIHIVLDMLSFKNDIQFWKNSTSFRGISVKSLFAHIVFTVITLLYILDSREDSSKYIVVNLGASIAIDLWKLTRVCTFGLKTGFPFVEITYQEAYTRSKTDDYDTTAIKFMSLLLFPCFLGYSIYSFIYKPHKGYYSFIVSTLAGGVYLFGFILMTPQLYINYKLKSVEHLPWRTLFYRFINTIIDDLFSFVIKMPVMHRIACFRDDIIFIIYMLSLIHISEPTRPY